MLRIFLERTPYQYINIRKDCYGKGVNGEGGSDETTVLRTRYQGSAGNLALTVLKCSVHVFYVTKEDPKDNGWTT